MKGESKTPKPSCMNSFAQYSRAMTGGALKAKLTPEFVTICVMIHPVLVSAPMAEVLTSASRASPATVKKMLQDLSGMCPWNGKHLAVFGYCMA